MTEIPTLTVSTRTNTEQTDILARLLATEDITIRHDRYAHTASFDVASRVLTLPVWEEMSGALYDMLTMHEVGHALHTPADGWASCDIIDTNKRNHPLVQMFYNIVEDARIERLMMEQFPGGVRDFRAAYENLHNERDLFELAGKDIDALGLADRINIHFKLGQFDLVNVNFTAEEQVFVDAINATQTWEDVVDATRDLYNYCKEQDKNNPTPEQEMPEQGDADSPEMGDGEGEDTAGGASAPQVPNFDHSEDDDTTEDGAGAEGGDESDDDAGETGESGSTGEDGEDGDESAEAKGDGSMESAEDGEDDGSTAESTDGADGTPAAGEEASKSCGKNNINVPQTVAAQERNMSALNNENGHGVENMGAPKISDSAITPWTTTIDMDNMKFYHENCVGTTSFIGDGGAFDQSRLDAAYANFINQNKKTIAKMAQQFEMKKAADEFKRTSISKSGRLDTTKMINYRWSEDIFAKNTTVHSGKNHGLVMVIDWSGSMSGNMKKTIEQAMCLALFCQKTGLPFEVFSFTSNNPAEKFDDHGWSMGCTESDCTIQMGAVEVRGCWLNQYLSSSMSKMQFVNSMKNMLMLAEAMDSYGRRGMHSLGGTPLNESFLILRDFMNDFKSRNNVQIAHTVYLTDGEGYGHILRQYGAVTNWKDGSFKYCSENDDRNENEVILDWYKKTTGSRVINFFLTDNFRKNLMYDYTGGHNDYASMEENWKRMKKEYTKENCACAGPAKGFDETFIIPSRLSTTNESGLENVGTDATNARLKSAFVKGQNARTASRALLNRFTDLIAD